MPLKNDFIIQDKTQWWWDNLNFWKISRLLYNFQMLHSIFSILNKFCLLSHNFKIILENIYDTIEAKLITKYLN